MKLKKVLFVAVVVAALIGGVSYAAIPSSSGVISACRDSQGRLKVIDAEAGQSCPAGQTPLNWNQQGPAGQNGVSGYELVTSSATLSSTNVRGAFVNCPTGKVALGGGAKAFGVGTNGGEYNRPSVALTQSQPMLHNGVAYGWGAYANEMLPEDGDWALRAYAVCATLAP